MVWRVSWCIGWLSVSIRAGDFFEVEADQSGVVAIGVTSCGLQDFGFECTGESSPGPSGESSEFGFESFEFRGHRATGSGVAGIVFGVGVLGAGRTGGLIGVVLCGFEVFGGIGERAGCLPELFGGSGQVLVLLRLAWFPAIGLTRLSGFALAGFLAIGLLSGLLARCLSFGLAVFFAGFLAGLCGLFFWGVELSLLEALARLFECLCGVSDLFTDSLGHGSFGPF